VSALRDVPTMDARIHSLAGMARALGSSHQLFTMVEIAAEEALHALAAASISVSRLEPGAGTIRTLLNTGNLGPDEERWPEREVYQLSDFATLRGVISDLRPWTASVSNSDSDADEVALLRLLDKGSSMAAPIVVDAGLWGELFATRGVDEDEFNSADAAYLEALAAILAGAVSRALHVESLERLAFFDPLTGLANRRALDEASEQAFETFPDRPMQSVTVVTLDLNGLKSVNDSRGHAEGDSLLMAVAATLTRHFASLDGSLVARVGGDEFSVLVPGHPVERVMSTANAMCAAVRRLPSSSGVSCGVATTVGSEWDRPQQLFKAADQAQYRAKKSGHRTAVLADWAP
jgi:diguanylate cyclase (GGDEF)-like protein